MQYLNVSLLLPARDKVLIAQEFHWLKKVQSTWSLYYGGGTLLFLLQPYFENYGRKHG